MEAGERVQAYIEARAKMTGLDPEDIHTLHGTIHLKISDLKAIRSALTGRGGWRLGKGLEASVEQALTDYWCDEGMGGTKGFIESLNAYGVQVMKTNWTPGEINAAFESSANQYELIERIGQALLSSHYLTAELIYEIHSVLGWQDGPPQSANERR